jgi:hypothetical protein
MRSSLQDSTQESRQRHWCTPKHLFRENYAQLGRHSQFPLKPGENGEVRGEASAFFILRGSESIIFTYGLQASPARPPDKSTTEARTLGWLEMPILKR